MADLSHTYGADLSIGATGDLAVAAGTLEGQQRVIRRLMTAPLDDIWSPTYGAGLPRFVGQPANPDAVAAVAAANMGREAAVEQSPPPAVEVAGDRAGNLTLSIRYADRYGQTSVLTLPLAEA